MIVATHVSQSGADAPVLLDPERLSFGHLLDGGEDRAARYGLRHAQQPGGYSCGDRFLGAVDLNRSTFVGHGERHWAGGRGGSSSYKGVTE